MITGSMPNAPAQGPGMMPAGAPGQMDPAVAKLLGMDPTAGAGGTEESAGKGEGEGKDGEKGLEERVSALEDIIGQLAAAFGISLPGEEAGAPAGAAEAVPAAPPAGMPAPMAPPGFAAGGMEAPPMAPKTAAEEAGCSPTVLELRRRLLASI